MTNNYNLMQILKRDTSGKNHNKGRRVFDNDLVNHIDISSEDNYIYIEGHVLSESLYSQYDTKIEMDAENKSIFSTYCSCMDFEKNEFRHKNYCCKHLVATYYKALGDLVSHPLLKNKEKDMDNLEEEYAIEQHSQLNIQTEYDKIRKKIIKEIYSSEDENGLYMENKKLRSPSVNKSIFKDEKTVLSTLLGENHKKDEIKIEVYLSKNQWSHNLSAQFKIGTTGIKSRSLYVLKDIEHFLTAYHNKFPINYSKNFIFNIREQRLSTKDKRLIGFIEMLKEIRGKQKYINRREYNSIDGKFINIPNYLVREFFEIIKDHRVYIGEGFFSRDVDTEILFEAPPVNFDLKTLKGDYVLKTSEGMPTVLGSKNNVFLYGSTIYLPDFDYCYKISPYLEVFKRKKSVTIDKREEDEVLRKLIPDLNLLTPYVNISKTIKDKVVMDTCSFNFYFDQQGKQIILTMKVCYGDYEFNIFEDCKEKIIYRDSVLESEVKNQLFTFGFHEIKGVFYFMREEDYVFKFFKEDIEELQKIGEVFYSENFKGLKSLGAKGIKASIKKGNYNYFEMDFELGDIPKEETALILRAFRDNVKYYKLKSGEYLDLEELELNKFLKLLDVVSPMGINDNSVEIAKNKSAYVDNYLEENDVRYVKGKKELKKIKDKLKSIENLDFTEPKDLKATLRNYQKLGYNWFKTLDFLGFGGILGDEMGLGKTLQTISFILSKEGSKSLVVAPTSLIYNWLSEFQKFAPSVRVIAAIGPKKSRIEILKNIDDYDVIVTTYNLAKRDLEEYKKINFDYCVIDEAQNIKNPHSQNAKALKEIRAKGKFALTGTPIENSLMELWSIFDFIMPGYLYDEKRFSVRYHKKLKESPVVLEELNKLIKPFILRRRKKEVLMELPDKIEKTLLVDLNDKQKKIYGTYANHAVQLIEKKVKEDEFKTSKIEILAYLTKLRQLCLDPSVLMNDYTGDSSKIEALIELLHQSIEENHRILVFSQFTSVLKNIRERLNQEEISYSYLDGSVSSSKRMEMVKSFNEEETSVFLISLKAGGTGLNLTSADIVIHFDPWWNPAVEAQATDRAHRIGQKNVVEVIKIIAKGTIEEKIIALQEEKKKLISELLGDELSGTEGFGSMSEEDILSLFEMK